MRPATWFGLVVAVLIVRRVLNPLPDPVRDNITREPPVRGVASVIDGDTIRLDDGTRVRLIGVDTPEVSHPDRPNMKPEPFGPEATEFTRQLVDGRDVRLEFDRERFDPYQRVLAYVYVDDRLLNEELILAGFSRAETRFPFKHTMKKRFREAELDAKVAKRGMWAVSPESR